MPLRITPTCSAAWVPHRADRPRARTLDLAVTWFEEQCTAAGTRGLLVTNHKMTMSVDPRLLTLARRHHFATPRTRAGAPWGVPVLAYGPDLAALHLAVERAHGAALCVVEGVPADAHGWASVTGALDLTHEDSADGTAGGTTDGTGGASRAPVDRGWLAAVDVLASDEHHLLADPDRTTTVLAGIDPARRERLPSALIARGVALHDVRRVQKLLTVLDPAHAH